MNQTEEEIFVLLAGLGGIGIISGVLGWGFLSTNSAIWLASLFSLAWAAGLYIPIFSKFERSVISIGCALTYSSSLGGYLYVFVSAVTALLSNGDSVADYGDVLLAAIGIGLPETLSTSQAAFLIFLIGATYFQIAAKLSVAYWTVVDRLSQ